MKVKILKYIERFTLFFIVSFLASFNYYVFFINGSGHSGLSPYYLFFTFLGISLFGGILLYIDTQNRLNKTISILIITFCVIGMLNVYLFDVFNIFLGYEEWIKRGLL